MTIQQMESKLVQIVALVAWVQGEVEKALSEIQTARAMEEALQEAAYAYHQEEMNHYHMLEALGNEDLQENDYSEKYMMNTFC